MHLPRYFTKIPDFDDAYDFPHSCVFTESDALIKTTGTQRMPGASVPLPQKVLFPVPCLEKKCLYPEVKNPFLLACTPNLFTMINSTTSSGLSLNDFGITQILKHKR